MSSVIFSIQLLIISCEQSKKRGLSLDEKREKMLQIFYDSQDFFLVSILVVILGSKRSGAFYFCYKIMHNYNGDQCQLIQLVVLVLVHVPRTHILVGND